tara:strand:+ start:2381 stop:2785 length:405 start_codon:yes stop_codon:yes gene_type:complete
MGFVLRKTASKIFRFTTKNISQIIGFVFGAFRKLPVRVGLAIIGSIYLVITFAAGFLWSWLAVTLENEELSKTVQDSFTLVLVIILIWISIATFMPSLERQPEIIQVTESQDANIVEITPRVIVRDDDEAELVE